MSFFITEANNSKKGANGGKKRKQARNDDLVDPDDYMPKRFGLKYNPPTIVMEYMVMSLGKLYHHKIKLMRLTPESDINEMVDYIYSRHAFYVKEEVVGRQQIANLVTRLQKRISGQPESQRAQPKAESKPKPAAKQVVTENPIPNSYLPSVEQKKPKAKNDWDDGGWSDNDDGDAWGDNNPTKIDDYNNFDMNKLTVEELQKEKAKMDVDFEKNKVKPGDTGFEYDVRKEFEGPKDD
jgi:hypothetical protein